MEKISHISQEGHSEWLAPRSLKEGALSLIFPRRCPVCGQIVMPRGGLICPPCVKKLSWVSGPRCRRCGKEVADETIEYCFDCSRRRHAFEEGMALINYNETASRSMAQIKYKNRREYLDFYAEAMLRRLGRKILRLSPDIILPVPVHPSRRRIRGFNQAEELARRLSEGLGIPYSAGILTRTRKTSPQKSLTPSERFKNLEQAFSARPLPKEVKTVLLVDDIYTTGATMEACARVLKKNGIQTVYFAVIFIGAGQ